MSRRMSREGDRATQTQGCCPGAKPLLKAQIVVTHPTPLGASLDNEPDQLVNWSTSRQVNQGGGHDEWYLAKSGTRARAARH